MNYSKKPYALTRSKHAAFVFPIDDAIRHGHGTLEKPQAEETSQEVKMNH
jgi:hypothetical protein